MKNLTFLICLFLTTGLLGQSIDDNRNRIKVTGVSQMEIEPTSFAIDIQVKEISAQPANYNFPLTIVINIDSLEKLLKQALDRNGYDSKLLKQIFMNTSGQSYGNNQFLSLIINTYEYDLKNLSDVNSFIKKIRFDGLAGIRIKKLFANDKTAIEEPLFKDAMKDAKSKAEKLASLANRTLGNIISIEETSWPLIINDESSGYTYSNNPQMDFVRTKSVSTSIVVIFSLN